MPLFDIECSECGQREEVLLRGGEPAVCSRCGSTKVNRLPSAVAAPVVRQGVNAAESLPMAGGCGRDACARGGCAGFLD